MSKARCEINSFQTWMSQLSFKIVTTFDDIEKMHTKHNFQFSRSGFIRVLVYILTTAAAKYNQ